MRFWGQARGTANMTEDQADRLWWNFGMFSLPKALIIAIISAIAVVQFTGSYGKAA